MIWSRSEEAAPGQVFRISYFSGQVRLGARLSYLDLDGWWVGDLDGLGANGLRALVIHHLPVVTPTFPPTFPPPSPPAILPITRIFALTPHPEFARETKICLEISSSDCNVQPIMGLVVVNAWYY